MKRKIVILLPLHKEKDKSKALTIVVAQEGVISVTIGKDNDRVEVIGEGVDSVCLAKSLRKKFCFADILSVEDVKPPTPPAVSACKPPPPCVPACKPPSPCVPACKPPPPCVPACKPPPPVAPCVPACAPPPYNCMYPPPPFYDGQVCDSGPNCSIM